MHDGGNSRNPTTGGTATIINMTAGDSATTVYQEGIGPADMGTAGTCQGATQTALIFLQATVVDDAGTACQLMSTETRASAQPSVDRR